MEKSNVKPKNLLLLPAAFLMTFSAHAVELTPTENLTATFTSTIEAGTCAAQIQNSSGTPTSAINFNDVYKSELKQKSKIQPFKLVFSACSGVKSAEITANPTAGTCSGSGASGKSFANNGGTAAATAVELWRNAPDSGTQFSCADRATPQTVALTTAGTTLNMNARMVIADGSTLSNVTSGNFIAPITFVIVYQ
jgi:type 1 fimbria pilin